MNGRAIFEKYDKIICLLVSFAKILPRGIRVWLLNMHRYRNGKWGMFFRYIAVSSLAQRVGKNVAIFPGVYFEYIENLCLGDNVSIHQMCYIDAEGGIEIGNDVSIAHRSTVLSSNHTYSDENIPIKYQDMKLERTTIDNNVWIGCGCVILAGVKIGTGAVIGANSTVRGSIPENSVAVGTPAKRIKSRLERIANAE